MGSAATDRPADAATPGLRERSRARRRVHIQRTAMRLFAERGYQRTTLADIADAAEVAIRTVTGYFHSKADLALSYADDVGSRLTASFAKHPGLDVLDVIDVWLSQEEELMDPETAALSAAMYEANPELQALSASHIAEASDLGRAALAARLGIPADHPMVDVITNAAGAALDAYLSALGRQGPSDDMHRWFMNYLRGSIDAGRPQPDADALRPPARA